MQGWSFSDVMFATKRNMASAVDSMSKQLEQVSSALAVCFTHYYFIFQCYLSFSYLLTNDCDIQLIPGNEKTSNKTP